MERVSGSPVVPSQRPECAVGLNVASACMCQTWRQQQLKGPPADRAKQASEAEDLLTNLLLELTRAINTCIPVHVCAANLCNPPLLPCQILTPRKLFVLPSKVAVYPSNVVSLVDVSPRFDEVKGTIHLDVSSCQEDWDQRNGPVSLPHVYVKLLPK